MTLTKDELEMIGLVQEEMAEVIQELSKVRRTGPHYQRHGGETSNINYLAREIIDVMITITFLAEAGSTGLAEEINSLKSWYPEYKIEKMRKWTNLSFLQGDSNDYGSN